MVKMAQTTHIQKTQSTATLRAKAALTGLSVWMVLLCVACQHKDLEHGGVSTDLTVRFDWTAAPTASPATMRLVAFSSTSQPVEIAIAGHDGYQLSLPAGVYQFLAYNSDTQDLYTQGTTFDTFEIGARPTQLSVFSPMFAQTRAIPRAPETDNQTVIFEPDQLWTSANGDVGLVAWRDNLLVMPMQEATKEYRFVINNVENLQYINELAATLSGMSGSWLPATATASDTECIIPFTLKSDGTSSLSGTVRTFGHCPGHDGDDHAEHMLVVYAQLQDGSKYYYTFDVTDAMHDPNHQWSGGDDPGTGQTEIPIELSDVPFPQPMYNGTGLHPTVDVWQEVDISMDM